MEASYEGKIINAIIGGDLKRIKTLQVNRYSINKTLRVSQLSYKPKYSGETNIINCSTYYTPTMLAILCEQDEILEHFLTISGNDLSIKNAGYDALTLAIMAKDHKCFDILIQTDYYHYHINDGTTYLHTAVSMKNYYSVYTLLKPFPEIKYRVLSEKDQEVESVSTLINVNAISPTTNSTALKIAVYLRDFLLVSILLDGGADPSYPKDDDEKGIQTCIKYTESQKESFPNETFFDKVLTSFNEFPDKSNDVYNEIEKYIKMERKNNGEEEYSSDDEDMGNIKSLDDAKTIEDLEEISGVFNKYITLMKKRIAKKEDISDLKDNLKLLLGFKDECMLSDDDFNEDLYEVNTVKQCCKNCPNEATKICSNCNKAFCESHFQKHILKTDE